MKKAKEITKMNTQKSADNTQKTADKAAKKTEQKTIKKIAKITVKLVNNQWNALFDSETLTLTVSDMKTCLERET